MPRLSEHKKDGHHLLEFLGIEIGGSLANAHHEPGAAKLRQASDIQQPIVDRCPGVGVPPGAARMRGGEFQAICGCPPLGEARGIAKGQAEQCGLEPGEPAPRDLLHDHGQLRPEAFLTQ